MSRFPYRLGVGMVVLNHEGKIFVGQRAHAPFEDEGWQMPQGGIEEGETPREAALRELEEEAGLRKVRVLRVSKQWYTYDFPSDLPNNPWKGSYCGQKQQWFLFDFLGQEIDVRFEQNTPEFTRSAWWNCSKLLERIIPFKRAVYFSVFKEFSLL